MKHLKIFNSRSEFEAAKPSMYIPLVVFEAEESNVIFSNSNSSVWYKIVDDVLYIRATQKEGYSERVLYSDTTQAKNGWYNDRAIIKKAVIEETIVPTSCARFFDNCTNMTTIEGWDNIKITRYCTSLFTMFQGCNKLTEIHCDDWDTSNVTNMAALFRNCNGLKSLDLSNWNTNNVTTLLQTFINCSSLTSVGDLSNWNVSNVTTMSELFHGCSLLTSIGDLSNWNVSKVTDMQLMFGTCHYLSNPNLSHVKLIGQEQYINNVEISSLYYDENLEKIGQDGLEVTFNDVLPKCLESITISESNTHFNTIDNELILSEDGKYCYGGADYGIGHRYETYTVPEGVTHMISGAFRSIGDLDLFLGQTAGYGKSETLPSGRVINTNLTLTHIVFPSTLEWIGDRICQESHNISTVTVKAVTPPTIYGVGHFNNHASDFKIYVPAESVDAYKTANGWKNWAAVIYPIEG